MQLGQEANQILQATPQPIHRPSHDDVELPLGGIPAQRVERRAPIPASGTRNTVSATKIPAFYWSLDSQFSKGLLIHRARCRDATAKCHDVVTIAGMQHQGGKGELVRISVREPRIFHGSRRPFRRLETLTSELLKSNEPRIQRPQPAAVCHPLLIREMLFLVRLRPANGAQISQSLSGRIREIVVSA